MNEMTLYQLADEFLEAAQTLQEHDLDEQTIADTLEGLTVPFEEKARGVAIVIKSFEADAIAVEHAEKELQRRRKRLLHRVEWLQSYLLINMQRTGIRKISHPLFDIALRKNQGAVEILDISAIPAQYMRFPEPPPPAPAKTEIAAAIKAGIDVPGARLNITEKVEIKL